MAAGEYLGLANGSLYTRLRTRSTLVGLDETGARAHQLSPVTVDTQYYMRSTLTCATGKEDGQTESRRDLVENGSSTSSKQPASILTTVTDCGTRISVFSVR